MFKHRVVQTQGSNRQRLIEILQGQRQHLVSMAGPNGGKNEQIKLFVKSADVREKRMKNVVEV